MTLPGEVSGHLYLHSMPGRHESWDEFMGEARRVNLDVIVCLSSEGEIRSKSPAYFRARSSGTIGLATKDFPIEDFGVPGVEEREAFRGFVRELAEELHAGKGVLIHCKMGIGRTGTVATCVLIELGLGTADALRAVERAGSNPEVTVQRRFIAEYSSIPPDADSASEAGPHRL